MHVLNYRGCYRTLTARTVPRDTTWNAGFVVIQYLLR